MPIMTTGNTIEDEIYNKKIKKIVDENGYQINNLKRTNYISWKEYFMNIAILSSYRSKDPVTQVGCCIVNSDNRILSIGYNGFPNGISDDKFPWGKCHSEKNYLVDKRFYVCHAEQNAILNCNNISLLKDSSLYTTLFPCNECMKSIIQVRIKNIIYLNRDDINKDSMKASIKMASEVGINIEEIDKNLKLLELL